MNNEYELYHYGVVGMKWGIRRGNAAKAYMKSSRKLDKLNKKATKYTNKANRKAQKFEKLMNKTFKDVDKKYIDEGRKMLAEYRSNRKKNEAML